MKVKILVDSTITAKAGQIVEVDEKEYKILKRFNRVEAIEDKKETRKVEVAEEVIEEKKQTRRAKR